MAKKKHKKAYKKLVPLVKELLTYTNGLCLCGRGESCSVCSRSSAQRQLEFDIRAILTKIGEYK